MEPSRIKRFITAAAVGLAAGVAAGIVSNWQVAVIGGWDVFVVVLVLSILGDFATNSAAQTAKMARADAMSHSVIDAIVLVTSLVSLGAVVLLITGKDAGAGHIVFGLVSIMLSWAAVHMLFTLRYATLYYRETEGGIDFNRKGEQPRFSDFAYLAYTIGMTYQVSDTVTTDYKIRRVVLLQGLVSFAYGVVIIASTINFIISLAQ